MAETTKRSDLIRKQLEKLLETAPQPYTKAEQDQIMKGRKKQADIDAGRAAIEARNKEVRDYNEQIKQLNIDLGSAETGESAAAEKQKREEGASPLANRLVPGAVGAAVGSGVTYGLNKIVGVGDKANAVALKEIGDEIGPTEKLTNSQMNRSRAVGAAEAAKQFTPTTKLAKALDFGKRTGTYAVPIGFIANEYQKYQAQADDESLPWEERQAAQRMANGFLGGFTGIGMEGAARFFNKKTEPGVGQAMMRINTARDYARRMDDKDALPGPQRSKLAEALAAPEEAGARRLASTNVIDAEVIPEPAAKALPAPQAAPETTPAPKPLNPGTAAYMRQQLKEFGVKGTSGMLKGELSTRLAEVMKEHGAKRTVGKKITKGAGKAAIPLAVGSYMAATGDSEAADASTAERAGNAAANFGVGAGAAYGGSKLVDALSKIAPMAMKAGGMGLSMLSPAMMTDITDGLAEQQAPDEAELMKRNAEVQSMPFLRHLTPGHSESYDIAQVPTPSPERRSEGPRVAEEAGGPAPFAPGIENRIRRMSGSGASPEQIAAFLNGLSL